MSKYDNIIERVFFNNYHEGDLLSVIDEKHYKLVNQEDISDIELQIMNEQE
jgi:hypothetical protein